jgi:NAD(P)-dependent dehydrogenase (short-subunit alcohol dehydrogenase family)
MKLKDKVALITGASQGIGAALVKAYRDRNYRVVATARSIKPTNDDDVLVVPGDIADRKTAERAVSEGVARFGRIDTLVNNAGIFIGKPFTQYTEADFAAMLGVNLAGFFHITQRAVAEMEAGRRPHRPNHHEPGRQREFRRALRARVADEGRPRRGNQIARHRIRQAWHPRERGRARRHQVADEPGRDP